MTLPSYVRNAHRYLYIRDSRFNGRFIVKTIVSRLVLLAYQFLTLNKEYLLYNNNTYYIHTFCLCTRKFVILFMCKKICNFDYIKENLLFLLYLKKFVIIASSIIIKLNTYLINI